MECKGGGGGCLVLVCRLVGSYKRRGRGGILGEMDGEGVEGIHCYMYNFI